jgi:hypothetical protein
LRMTLVNNFCKPLRNLDITVECGQYWRLREDSFQCEKC